MSDLPERHDSGLPCPERVEAMALHAGGDLAPAEARELERHLAECPGCRSYLAALEESRRVWTALAVPLTETAMEADVARVHRRVMDEVRSETRARTVLLPPRWRWAAVAALVLLVLGAGLVWRLRPSRAGDSSGASETPIHVAERPPEPSEPDRVTPVPVPPETGTPEPSERSHEPRAPHRERPTRRPEHPPSSQPPTHRASLETTPDLKIQLVSDDPTVVIYWLVESEKPDHATPKT